MRKLIHNLSDYENPISLLDSPKGAKVSKTQKEIVHTLLDLLKCKALEDISVRDICKQANIHRSTFYRHYRDKYHLFESSLASMLSEICMNTDISQGTPAFNIGLAEFEMVEKYRFLFNAILITDTSGTARRIFQEVTTDAILRKADWIISHVEGEEQRIVAANYYSGAMLTVIEWWLKRGLRPSAAVMANYIATLHPDVR